MSDTVVVIIAVLILATVIGFIARGAWKAFTPKGFVFYLVMWACLIFAGICSLHSTIPSSAPRRQVNGIIGWINDRHEGKSHTYTFGLARPDEPTLNLQASALLPFFAKGQDLVSVTYLDENVTARYPRAIGFRVLSGPRAGYNDVVSADWFGPWLGVIIAPPCGFAALWVAFSNKRSKPPDHAEGNFA